MIEENLHEGTYRKEIYACVVGVIKREITVAEHKYLSHVLKLYANAVADNRPATKHEPLIHNWVCTKCATETVAVGKNKNIKIIKRARQNSKLEKAKNEKETHLQ